MCRVVPCSAVPCRAVKCCTILCCHVVLCRAVLYFCNLRFYLFEIVSTGEPGLREATGLAILNANYMAKRIEEVGCVLIRYIDTSTSTRIPHFHFQHFLLIYFVSKEWFCELKS